MKIIKLYGHLGKQFGKIHKYYVNTPAEAIKLLSANYKGFEQAILGFKGEGYRIIVGKEDVIQEDIHNSTGQDVIKIVPVISGSGGGNGKTIIQGIILIVAAYFTFGAGAGAYGGVASASGSIGAYVGAAMTSYGIALVIGGIAAALYTPPTTDIAKLSVAGGFDGAQNTTRQGVPVPVGYGDLIVGSAVISAGITTVAVQI